MKNIKNSEKSLLSFGLQSTSLKSEIEAFINRSQYCPSSTSDVVSEKNCSLKIESEVWFTSPQAAAFLGLSIQALMNKVSSGKIPYAKLGRLNRYKKSDLERLLSQIKKGPAYGN